METQQKHKRSRQRDKNQVHVREAWKYKKKRKAWNEERGKRVRDDGDDMLTSTLDQNDIWD